jgi:uncharacterized protein HemX
MPVARLVLLAVVAMAVGCSQSPEQRYDEEFRALQNLAIETEAARKAGQQATRGDADSDAMASHAARYLELKAQFEAQQKIVDEARREMTGIGKTSSPLWRFVRWVLLSATGAAIFFTVRWARNQHT